MVDIQQKSHVQLWCTAFNGGIPRGGDLGVRREAPPPLERWKDRTFRWWCDIVAQTAKFAFKNNIEISTPLFPGIGNIVGVVPRFSKPSVPKNNTHRVVQPRVWYKGKKLPRELVNCNKNLSDFFPKCRKPGKPYIRSTKPVFENSNHTLEENIDQPFVDGVGEVVSRCKPQGDLSSRNSDTLPGPIGMDSVNVSVSPGGFRRIIFSSCDSVEGYQLPQDQIDAIQRLFPTSPSPAKSNLPSIGNPSSCSDISHFCSQREDFKMESSSRNSDTLPGPLGVDSVNVSVSPGGFRRIIFSSCDLVEGYQLPQDQFDAIQRLFPLSPSPVKSNLPSVADPLNCSDRSHFCLQRQDFEMDVCEISSTSSSIRGVNVEVEVCKSSFCSIRPSSPEIPVHTVSPEPLAHERVSCLSDVDFVPEVKASVSKPDENVPWHLLPSSIPFSKRKSSLRTSACWPQSWNISKLNLRNYSRFSLHHSKCTNSRCFLKTYFTPSQFGTALKKRIRRTDDDGVVFPARVRTRNQSTSGSISTVTPSGISRMGVCSNRARGSKKRKRPSHDHDALSPPYVRTRIQSMGGRIMTRSVSRESRIDQLWLNNVITRSRSSQIADIISSNNPVPSKFRAENFYVP